MVVAGKSVHSVARMKHGCCVSVSAEAGAGWEESHSREKKRNSHAVSPGLSAELAPSSGPGESGLGEGPDTLLLGHLMSSGAAFLPGLASVLPEDEQQF